MDNIQIRLEKPKDERIVEEITREAFWNLYTMGASEHFMVHCLRKSKDYLKNLGFVALINEEIVGAIFYSASKVVDEAGNIFHTITFAPVSVKPGFQCKGVGLKLIRHSLSIALKEKHHAVIILGSPEYYKRFGFIGGKKYNVSAEDDNFYKSLLVLELQKGYFDTIQGIGKFSYSPVFNVNETEVEKFDENFPTKEKKKTKSQEEFENIATQIDE